MTLGSLFDGIGGFPLAAQMYGITPLWASEIEAAPISITKRHFPDMKHYGDVIKINGAELPPVDIITFGSPCQDMSAAVSRSGLDGSRSCLFYEAVRIIKEMRNATNGRYPAYAIWENVPGAFSSHGGEDFRRVLEALSESKIPMPDNGKWAESGMVRLSDREIAWRTLNARYWGVPQRRKRIYLVADFRGKRAAEILFKPESLLGYTPQSGNEGQRIRTFTESSFRAAGFVGQASPAAGGIGCKVEIAPTLRAGLVPDCLAGAFEMSHADEVLRKCEGDISPTLQARMGTGGNQIPLVFDAAYCIGNGQTDQTKLHKLAGTLNCMHDRQAVIYAIDRAAFNQGQNAKYDFDINCKGINSTLTARGASAVCAYDVSAEQWAARRLTPLECERLQGFPDNWTKYGADDKEISDAARCKALGNSLAIPCALRVIGGIADYERRTKWR